MNIRNIGIAAHIDAGKTTLSERLLFRCGAIQKIGSVDKGTAHTDTTDIERRRGISVRAACARLSWRDAFINLVDTPGHADFASEIERAFWALDAVVLVVSAPEGVQPQTETLLDVIRACKLPALIFVNKTDRPGADVPKAVQELNALPGEKAVLLNAESVMEARAEEDEAALEMYLNGQIEPLDKQLDWLRAKVRAGEIHPVLQGSALTGAGVDALLDAIVDLLPPPDGDANGPLSGVVFASDPGAQMGRASHVRLFSGSLQNRDVVPLPDPRALPGAEPDARKVSQIRRLKPDGKGEDLGTLPAGEIAAVYGLGDARVGQTLGDPALLPAHVRAHLLREPPLMARVDPAQPDKMDDLRAAVRVMALEDPALEPMWIPAARQLRLRVMGAIQLEVLEEQLKTRFGIDTAFAPPTVIYRETIAQPAEGFVAYTMPKPCWAVLKFYVEPGPRGSGIRYDSVVPVRKIDRRYQHQVEQALPGALRQGRLGWQVDDVKITLVDGEHHLIHTHPLDFIVATPMGLHDALRRGGQTLLEPMLECRIVLPETYAGRLMGDITAMRGELIDSRPAGDMLHVTCLLPARDSVDYPVRLAAYTGGRGAMASKLTSYRACPPDPEAVCPRRSVDPLDTSKYILAARSALDGGIFD